MRKQEPLLTGKLCVRGCAWWPCAKSCAKHITWILSHSHMELQPELSPVWGGGIIFQKEPWMGVGQEGEGDNAATYFSCAA